MKFQYEKVNKQISCQQENKKNNIQVKFLLRKTLILHIKKSVFTSSFAQIYILGTLMHESLRFVLN